MTIQIKAVLNSRPLCPLSDDASDLTASTPGHFLIGEPPTTIPEPSLRRENFQTLTLADVETESGLFLDKVVFGVLSTVLVNIKVASSFQ